MGSKRSSAATRGAGGGSVSSGKAFFDSARSGGRWAGEQMLRAMQEGRTLSAGELRTLDTLRKDEWKQYDQEVVREGVLRMRAVQMLIGAGLVIPITNGLGKTILQWETMTDMDAAGVSLDGLADTDNDAAEFTLNNLPLPIVHKDFFLGLRQLLASRERGEGLDVVNAGMAGRVVGEKVESMLFDGGPTFGGAHIYGLRTHPSRIYVKFGNTNAPWSDGSVDGGELLNDLLAAVAALNRRRFYGPFAIFVGSAIGTKLEGDFKANGSDSIRQRMLKVDQVQSITVSDQLVTDEVVIVQLTRDVVSIVDAEPLQTIQWDVHSGFRINFKVMTIKVPLIRATQAGRSGIVHISNDATLDFADIVDV